MLKCEDRSRRSVWSRQACLLYDLVPLDVPRLPERSATISTRKYALWTVFWDEEAKSVLRPGFKAANI